MIASYRVILVLSATAISFLSQETVTKERMREKAFPIRVVVLPHTVAQNVRTNGTVLLKFEVDHGESERERVTVALKIKDSSSQKIIADVPVAVRTIPGDEIGVRTSIATLEIAPEFALSSEVVISQWLSTSEHKYRIPLKLFADEIREAKMETKK